VTNKFH